MLREQIKAALEQIAKTENGVLSEFSDELRLFIREGEGMNIVLKFYPSYAEPSCETQYMAKGKTFTFDRLGVEASFYFEGVDKLPAEVTKQRQRVKEAQARLASTAEFNLGPVRLMLSPERLQQIVDTIKAGKTHTYMPSGFGTGYYFSIRSNIRNRFDRAQASPELVKLVGQQVYVSSFDAD